jgi:antitoxin (DNA-binding transcriptional repressor) of toxin-antitoxin stability system
MTSLTIEEAQSKLKDVIDGMKPGEAVQIVKNLQPVATLIRASIEQRKPRQPGNCAGMLTVIAEDDEHLSDFSDYMP